MADTAQKNKKDQASKLRHDLKTPLTTIMGYSELLAAKLPSEHAKEQRWAKAILSEAKRMLKLIDSKIK